MRTGQGRKIISFATNVAIISAKNPKIERQIIRRIYERAEIGGIGSPDTPCCPDTPSPDTPCPGGASNESRLPKRGCVV